jgi:hypothetical protein
VFCRKQEIKVKNITLFKGVHKKRELMGIGSNVVSLQQMELQICEGHALHRHWIVRNIVSGNLHKHMSVREPCEHMTCTTATATHWTPVIVATADQPQPVSRTRPRRGVRYALSDLCAQHKTGDALHGRHRAAGRGMRHVRIAGCVHMCASTAARRARRGMRHVRIAGARRTREFLSRCLEKAVATPRG